VRSAITVERNAMVRGATARSASAIPQTIPPSHKSARAAIRKVVVVVVHFISAAVSPAVIAADAY
jgi:hypothetical protein